MFTSPIKSFVAVTSLAAVTIAVGFATKAHAYTPGFGCYPYLAAQTIHQVYNGGGSIELARATAYNEGEHDGTKACDYRVITVLKKYGHVM